jgi:ABC-2 type transport system permease protein
MNKILIIIQREFLNRVRKKTFIIGTILFPVLYIALIFGTGYIADKTREDLKVALVDQSGLFTKELANSVAGADTANTLVVVNIAPERLAASYDSLGYDAYVVVPQNFSWSSTTRDTLTINAKKSFGVGAATPIEKRLNQMLTVIKNDSLGLDAVKQGIINRDIALKFKNDKDKNANAGIATVIGYVCGFLMYLILLLYGSQVMMGVTEEKTNRIAEVVVSSVKPFQLMLGKIVGIALVALAQFLIWIVCIFAIYNFTKSGAQAGAASAMVGKIQAVFTSVNVPLTVGCFIFYLLGGFFFYSSLYAAIGSAINEDMREAQSLSFPITMLVIFSIALMTPAISNPGSSVAVWASIVPFSSPIVMMARIPFGVPDTVPYWQLALSMLLLILAFVASTWFAGRIYRTGILMYGKKPTWKEMIKWAFRK